MTQPDPTAPECASPGPQRRSWLWRPLLVLARRLVSFILVGGIATAAQYLLLITLVELFGVFAITASMAAYAGGALVSYLLNFHVTFHGRAGHRQALPRFIVVVAIGLGVNTLSFALLLLFLPYLLAQVGATLVTLVSNYLLHQYWIYRPAK
uniref:GtrA family protein n=1 Tax=Microbulbifer agarilyticus TaxID=260552 RepID=UPI001303549A|nr:GtrA family protein [Microbulbifer agarilyticus]